MQTGAIPGQRIMHGKRTPMAAMTAERGMLQPMLTLSQFKNFCPSICLQGTADNSDNSGQTIQVRQVGSDSSANAAMPHPLHQRPPTPGEH